MGQTWHRNYHQSPGEPWRYQEEAVTTRLGREKRGGKSEGQDLIPWGNRKGWTPEGRISPVKAPDLPVMRFSRDYATG